MHIVLPAGRRTISETGGGAFDGFHDVPFGLRLACVRADRGQRESALDSAGPGTEVLGREIFSGDLAQKSVYVGGVKRVELSELVRILEQFVAGKVPALSDDTGKTPVFDTYVVHLPAFSTEMEPQRVALDLNVTITQGREAVRGILFRIFFVPYPNESGFEQSNYGCDYLFPREIGAFQILLDPLAYLRQGGRKLEHTVEFRLVANQAILRVVAILATAACVHAGRLEMTVFDGADPDLVPCRWNNKGANTSQQIPIPDETSVCIEISEPFAASAATQARRTAGDVSQPGDYGRFSRVRGQT